MQLGAALYHRLTFIALDLPQAPESLDPAMQMQARRTFPSPLHFFPLLQPYFETGRLMETGAPCHCVAVYEGDLRVEGPGQALFTWRHRNTSE